MAYGGMRLRAEGEKDGGQLISGELARQGVSHVFGIAGGHINPIWYSLDAAGIKLVDVRHEVSAANAAAGFALASGKPGVCIVTAGPGATNAVTGLVDAQLAGYPVVCIAGSSTLHGDLTGEVQEMDQIGLFRSFCKWAERCTMVERLPEYVGLAMRAAMSGRPGVAYLEVPVDVMHSIAENDGIRTGCLLDRESLRVAPSAQAISEAARLISEARRPLLVAGSGVHWSGAQQALQELVQATGIPFSTRMAGRGAVSDAHPLSIGGHWERAVTKADVIVSVGSRFNYRFGYGRFDKARHIIQIDIDPNELGRPAARISAGIAADAKLALEALTAAIRPGDWKGWAGELRAEVDRVNADFERAGKSAQQPIHSARVVREVREAAGQDAIFDQDGSDNVLWTEAGLHATGPGKLLGMGPFGSLGNGIGRLIGAGCANPGKPLIWMVGDGSFGFNCMELDTAQRFDLPIVAVVMNNLGWGGEQWVPLGLRHYERLAPGFGIEGELVDDPEQLEHALGRAIAAGKPYIVNVVIEDVTEYFTPRA